MAHVTQGRLQPASEYKGTVYFKEISDLAAEVSGKAVAVQFEEGDHLDEGAPMVRLDAEVLEQSLAAARARLAQQRTLLEQEQVRFERAKELLDDEVTTEQQFDDIRFTVESIEHNVAANAAEVARLDEELARKTIYAPFPGVVAARNIEVGEWVSAGTSVATFARDHVYDVIVNVPEEHVRWNQPGQSIGVAFNGDRFPGKVVAVLPLGDVATRTFPVKIRLEGTYGLLEGMSASVRLPIGEEQDCLLVPRDAVLLQQGQHIVVTASEGKAQPIPIVLLGYEDRHAGVEAEALKPGMQVAVKGHERLRPGQSVAVAEVAAPSGGNGAANAPR